MYAQPVQNILPGNIVLRDITLTYMPADPKYFLL
jgi:hypothetical protein